jgi:hypothetical protein
VSPQTSKAKKHSKIETLAPVIRDLLDQSIQHGDSAAKISSWLKAEHNVSISEESIRRYMQRFLSQKVEQGIQQYRNYLKGLPEAVDAAKALAEAIVIQKARIGQMLHREKEETKTFTSTDKAIEVLRETSATLIECELRMGIRKSAPPGGGATGSSDTEVVDIIKTALTKVNRKEDKPTPNEQPKPASNDGQLTVPPTV